MTPPPPRPTTLPPVSKGRKLVAELYNDWEEVTPHDDEHTRMVPKYSPLALMKHTANIKATSPPVTPKITPPSPASDLNSNSLSHDQMLLSLYWQDGGNSAIPYLPSPSNHPSSPSTLQGRKAKVSSTRGPSAGVTGQSSMLDSVGNEDRDGGGLSS